MLRKLFHVVSSCLSHESSCEVCPEVPQVIQLIQEAIKKRKYKTSNV